MRFPLVLAAVAIAPLAVCQAEEPDGAALDAEVGRLVLQLGADAQADRSRGRERLLELSRPTAAAGERMLSALPEPNDRMPAAVREALAEIRTTIEERLARLAVSASLVTIDVVQEPLADVLRMIEEQTGNKIVDRREQFGQRTDERLVSLSLQEAPFWEAIDALLDEAGLGVYSYSGEPVLSLISRDPGEVARSGGAAYAGPLRIEAVRIVASRNLRQSAGASLNLQLEVAWEPRLTPIALSQPLSEVEAKNERGDLLSMARPERSIDIEIQSGAQATDLTLPLLLPARNTTRIASLKGTMQAIVPGRVAEFRFGDLANLKEPAKKKQGGATVTLQEMRKSGEIWELTMRLKLEGAKEGGAGDAFASHRGWVFNNATFVEDKDGQPLEHQGYEMAMARGDEIGLIYLFDLPDGPEGLTWVYRTPTAIVRFPIEYELGHIPLP